MLYSLSRSAMLRKFRTVATRTATRAMSVNLSTDVVEPAYDSIGKTEEDFENELRSLNLPKGLAIVHEHDDHYEVEHTDDAKKFSDHLCEYAIYNEFTEHPDAKPYSDAVGLDFNKKLTLGTFFSLTALSNEWYVMNEETAVVACFLGAAAATYIVLGPMLTKWYTDYKSDFISGQNKAEDAHIAGCKLVLEGFPNEKIQQNLELMYEEQKSVIEAEAKARVITERNVLVNSYQSQLEKLVIAKTEASNKEYQNLLSQTVEGVREKAADTKFKKSALEYAMNAATNKPAGNNPTVDLYDSILKGLSK